MVCHCGGGGGGGGGGDGDDSGVGDSDVGDSNVGDSDVDELQSCNNCSIQQWPFHRPLGVLPLQIPLPRPLLLSRDMSRGSKNQVSVSRIDYLAVRWWHRWWLTARLPSRLEVAVDSEIERQRGLAWCQYIEQVARSIVI